MSDVMAPHADAEADPSGGKHGAPSQPAISGAASEAVLSGLLSRVRLRRHLLQVKSLSDSQNSMGQHSVTCEFIRSSVWASLVCSRLHGIC